MPRPFSSAFIAREPTALSFLSGDYRDAEHRKAAAVRASRQPVSPALVEILLAQDRALPPCEIRRANILALAQAGTVAVVTGQQVGLFLGPLYTIYKAASAIALARAVEHETGLRCVPIFWLQTEDHDFEEIRACHVPATASGPLEIALCADEPGAEIARYSVAQRVLGGEIESLLATMNDALAPLPHAAEVSSLLRDHYRPGRTLWSAFAGAIASIFKGDGLVVFNPRDAAVAELAAPLHAQMIDDAQSISRGLAERGRALVAAGFAEQVHVRPDAPLNFVHVPDATGPRHRLEKRANGYGLVGDGKQAGASQTIAAADLKSKTGLCFSTSALLRPLLQDTLFPTVTYVGGPGEINYLAQLGPLYAHVGREQPLIALRARFRVVDDTTRSLLRRLSLSPEGAERSRASLLAELAARPDHNDSQTAAAYPPPDAVKRDFLDEITHKLIEFERLASTLDRNLVSPVQKTRDTITQAVSRLTDRYAKSLLLRDTITVERVDRVRAILYPLEQPQERVYGLPWFAARYGLAHFKATLFSALAPFDTTVVNLSP